MSDYSNDDDHDPRIDALHETALVTLDTLVSSCSQQMEPYLANTIQSALRFLKYDPNLAEMDEEMGGTQDVDSDDSGSDDDDFDEEDGYSDVDDMSWKVRRCAVKLLHTVVSNHGSSRAFEESTLYSQVVSSLISRITKETDEGVKLEVVSTLTSLVQKTSEGSVIITSGSPLESVGGSRNSRKRRRQDSDANMMDFEPGAGASSAIDSPVIPCSPKSGSQSDLISAVPLIIQSLTKAWKKASITLRQAIIVLLKSLSSTRYGGLTDHLPQIELLIADVLKNSSAAITTSHVGAFASTGSLHIETLGLISTIAETHFTEALLPFLLTLVPGVLESVTWLNYKVSSAALGAVEQFIKTFTPPRVLANSADISSQLASLYDVVFARITDTSADLEVRQRAIHALGVLLARTSGDRGAEYLSADRRSKGLVILVDRAKNETTRVAAISAIDDVAVLATRKEDISSELINMMTLELSSNVRKSDRALRSSCLEALRSIAMNTITRSQLTIDTITSLENDLLPLLAAPSPDFHIITPALIIVAQLVPINSKTIVNEALISSVCSIVKQPLTGTVLKALLLLVKVVGDEGAGASLMQSLLQNVGITGDFVVVGRAIGTLLVHGGPSLGVKMDDFSTELRTTKDENRKCLALVILGEIGLRMGAECSLAPNIFTDHFTSESAHVRLAAATSLGNAAAGNVEPYLDIILTGLVKSNEQCYLLLNSVREMLRHVEVIRPDLASSALKLWQALLVVSGEEENRAAGSECLGRLALIDPPTYLPHIQECLSTSDTAVRGVLISAFRYTLADSSENYKDLLGPLIVPILSKMLSDSDLGNHRLALTALNSAIVKKMDLLRSSLNELLPIVFGDTHIKPELIREVPMGPFKHKVDDGLELRKTAYEVLHASLDTPFTISHFSQFFNRTVNRILAGIEDEQDIRTISNLMTARLISIAPKEIESRLDAFSDGYRSVLSVRLKENSVRHEVAQAHEASLGVLKITKQLSKALPGAEESPDLPKWKEYMRWVRNSFETAFNNLD
ncbi:hypothetical protein N7495_006452 [Penicillium taxi]|uniref:uncharacterized protein n=1 Tax=Penicillium taxi TaxID=168475 RepID=UPI002544DE31|nr:uncharacterized protein N7495_006452 [Penicillium taxi]KAJ5894761.1 hypothetical protein N7495_006452 [Penicillium taxi]